MLSTIERRQDIVQQAMDKGRIMVVDLAKQYGVSTVTIRNDLNNMNKSGLLVRTRGGQLPAPGLRASYRFKNATVNTCRRNSVLGVPLQT